MADLDTSARPALGKGRSLGLDVLRVAATVLVLLSHFGVFSAVHWQVPHADLLFIAGPLGLAGFFVLSGFLIGNMLLNIVERGPSFREWKIFTTRRLLRVMPTYILWLVLLSMLASTQQLSLSRFVHYLTLTQSFAWPMPSDNWFGVSWSLAIEVWFYLLFGALSLVAAAVWGYRALLAVLAAFLLLPLIARACMPVALPWDAWVRKITVLRLDAIATGVAVAVAMRRAEWMDRHHLKLAFSGVVCLLGIVVWWVLDVGRFELQTRAARTLIFNGLQLGVALLIPALLRLQCESSFVRHIWAWLSDATYAIYLVHLNFLLWALILVDRGMFPFAVGMTLAFAVTIIWAALSLHFIERPIRRYRLGL
ncbi:acyltransferase [Rhodanobacter sp. MP1X3]|jgi:peptidoglycan/LPS O-acetylase OafA/YrhL|uniref:acyltransferase family protein n=1 Tax=Rhodanobacter sp. MP1X3 TaxID=2723086 RepID=UPI0016083626|nr:acyltransferase [Rhodanobacter sp. MP1X3]MBB6240987.1 peptidoglycan/LPS O-acetylase OafA/YrhL [Rhodanobacter sp. MP1X3]